MPDTFIWADGLFESTIRVAWDHKDTFTAYDIASGEVVEEFTAKASTIEEARDRAAHWWAERLATNIGAAEGAG